MSIFAFNDNKEKVRFEVFKGVASIPVGETGVYKLTVSAVGEDYDFKDWAIVSVMSGHGNDIGDTDNEGNPITPMKVVNGRVYPSAEFNMYESGGTGGDNKINIYLYNDTPSTGTKVWFRLVLMKVDNE